MEGRVIVAISVVKPNPKNYDFGKYLDGRINSVRGEMESPVNWRGIADIGEKRVLDALSMALNGKRIPEIARETRIPESSLYSIRKDGPFAHLKHKKGRAKN
jgi:hypothetical protein